MKLYPLRLVPSGTKFDFINFKIISYWLSIILITLSILSITVYKFNFGIDFSGGIAIELRVNKIPDLAKMRKTLSDLEIGEISLQNFGSEYDLQLRIGSSSEENLTKFIEFIKETLSKNFTYDFEYRKIDFVGPQVGSHLIKSGALALTLAFAAIMCYIALRFEWYYGLGVLIALLHDTIIALGFMSILGLDFNLSSIAGLLTIIGYSVNDSVVIYDRIRENLRKFSKKTLPQIINVSVNETLSRTVLTVLTTLLANLALIIFGGEALYSFSLLVFFGIIIGTYSSIFISAPILTLFKK